MYGGGSLIANKSDLRKETDGQTVESIEVVLAQIMLFVVAAINNNSNNYSALVQRKNNNLPK